MFIFFCTLKPTTKSYRYSFILTSKFMDYVLHVDLQYIDDGFMNTV